jgi:hypothetical protein
MAVSEKLTHVAEALARLPEQFKGKANIAALLELLVTPVQTLESELWSLQFDRRLANATGDLLDSLGKLIGQPRLAFDDDEYRLMIAGRIAANRSSGTIESVLGTLIAVSPTNTFELIEDTSDGAAFSVEVSDVIDAELARVMSALLQVATPAGVQALLLWQEVADASSLFTSLGTQLAGGETAGATTVDVDSTAGFPTTGTIMLSQGTSLEESKAYTGVTATTFTGVTALSNTHADGATVRLTTDTGLSLAISTQINGTEAIGQTTLTVDDASAFAAAPATITIDAGTTKEETLTYSAKSGTTFTTTATTIEHLDGASVTQGGGALSGARAS